MNANQSLFVALALSAFIGVAAHAAQPAAPAPVVGTVLSVAKDALQLRTTQMQQVTVAIGAQTRVVDTVNIALADIRNGDFLGTTASPKDGELVASEVHVFDEALRGTGEGHYPFAPGSTMTNGAVATMTNGAVSAQGAAQQGGAGLTMTVAYKGGQQTITVPPGTPVTRLKVVDVARVKVGMRVTVFGTPKTATTLEANMISLTPPAPAPK